jgi:hypothetical protein
MHPDDLFDGFSEAQQKEYDMEASQRWNPELVSTSKQKWSAFPAAEKTRILEEGKALYRDLAGAMSRAAASSEAQDVIGRWHAHLQHFWSPTDEQLLGLADLYNDDHRFRAGYEKVRPGLAVFMSEAVQLYVGHRKK